MSLNITSEPTKIEDSISYHFCIIPSKYMQLGGLIAVLKRRAKIWVNHNAMANGIDFYKIFIVDLLIHYPRRKIFWVLVFEV